MVLHMIEKDEWMMRNTTQYLATKLTDVNAKLESLLVTAKESSPVDTCDNGRESVEKYSKVYSEALDRIYQATLRLNLTGDKVDLEDDADSISLRQLMVANVITLNMNDRKKMLNL